MASVLAIVAKKVFDKECPGGKPGGVFATAGYASAHKALDALAGGGALFLATVRPPDERLWLVAILEAPKKSVAGGGGWKAKPNVVPIADVTSLRPKIRFAGNTGITDKKGALGMSLQTPRVLTADDERLLRAASGAATAVPVPVVAARAAPAPAPATPVAPAPATPVPSDVFFFSEEARKYLRARSAADLDADTGAAKKRRALAAERVGSNGGFTAAVRKIAGGKTSAFAARDVGDLLLLEPESVRASALAAAEEAWPRAGVIERAALLECFPRRADWALELGREWRGGKLRREAREVLVPSLADGELILEIIANEGPLSSIVNIVVSMGEAAVPVLTKLLELARYPNEEKAVARALGCVGTAEAAAAFVENLRRKHVRPYATEFFAHFPHLAKDALGELAAKKTQVAGVARDILARVERAHRQASPASPGAFASAAAEEASMDEVPSLLRTPPWEMQGAPKRRRIIVPDLVMPDEPQRMHWPARERMRWIAEHFQRCGTRRSEDDVRKLQSDISNGHKVYVYGNYPEEIVLRLLVDPPPNVHVWDETAGELAALHGERVLGAVILSFERRMTGGREILRFESPRIAASLARHHLGDVYTRHAALWWIERYPETAALGLVPVAVGPDGKGSARPGAEQGLRFLVRIGHAALVRRVADSFGKPARESVEEILAWDERNDGPKKPPKMPPTYRPAELRAPVLKNSKVLPRKAVENLDMLLRASAIDYPVAGLDEVRAACDSRSLAEHVWDLAKAWDIDGAKESQIWMLHAVAHLGDDEVVRRLTPALKGEGIAKMLGSIGTDAALMELVTILVRVTQGTMKKRPKYAWGTEQAIDIIAARRGTDRDVLEDHFVPTCNVDAEGGITLDVGGTTIRVTFDHQLSRILENENGDPVKALPRTSDDPAKLAAATTLLHDLDEDVSAIALLRASSLERAMIDGRTWTLDDFRDVWVDHPLMVHMARGVVWEARDVDGKLLAEFRVAEDGSFADAGDAQVELPKEAVAIGVAHAARLGERKAEAWRKIFVDYKLLQPFEQLARKVALLPANELAASTRSERCTREVFRAAEERLQRVGWSWDNARVYALPTQSGVYGELRLDGDQVVVAAVRAGRSVTFADIDDVARCELVRGLEIVTGAR